MAAAFISLASPSQSLAKEFLPDFSEQEVKSSPPRMAGSVTERQMQLLKELRDALHIRYRLTCLTHSEPFPFSYENQDKFSADGQRKALAETCKRIAEIGELDIATVEALFEVNDKATFRKRWQNFVESFFPEDHWFFYLEIGDEFKGGALRPFPSVTLAFIVGEVGKVTYDIAKGGEASFVGKQAGSIYIEPFRQFLGYPYAYFSVYPPNTVLFYPDKTMEVLLQWQKLAERAPKLEPFLKDVSSKRTANEAQNLRKEMSCIFIQQAISKINIHPSKAITRIGLQIGAHILADMNNDEFMYSLQQLYRQATHDFLFFRAMMHSIASSPEPIIGWAMYQYYNSHVYGHNDKSIYFDQEGIFRDGYEEMLGLVANPSDIEFTDLKKNLSSFINSDSSKQHTESIMESDVIFEYVQIVQCPKYIQRKLAVFLAERLTSALYILRLNVRQLSGSPLPCKRAIQLTKRGLDLQPSPDTKLVAASIFWECKEYEDAKDIYQEIVAAKEGSLQANAKAALYLGLILRSEGKHKEADEFFRKAVDLDAEEGFVAYARMADFRMERDEFRDFDEALALYKKYMSHAVPVDHSWVRAVRGRISLLEKLISMDDDIDKQLTNMTRDEKLAAAEAETSSETLLAALATCHDPLIRYRVAKNPSTPLGILDYLYKLDGEELVKTTAKEYLNMRKKE